ncbi:hypothetical protein [uncultured Christiangramia sp.]|uniref:hypothetical protein n=1 Tax=Christiangramia sp. 3-2217-3z TaxID=3417564 RepID=UPI0026131719|nr:hypothetical protein [uncultured Christiangramia sp.]
MSQNFKIKHLFIFFVFQITLAQSDRSKIVNIDFNEKDSIELKKYLSRSNNKKLKFFFRNKYSLKSPIFIYDIEKSKRILVNVIDVKLLNFTDPWKAYWTYHQAKEKPILFLYEFDVKSNSYYKYPVTIEFPPPPPIPKPIR